MTQYNTLSVKLSVYEIKLKSAIKNGTEVSSNFSYSFSFYFFVYVKI